MIFPFPDGILKIVRKVYVKHFEITDKTTVILSPTLTKIMHVQVIFFLRTHA